LASLRSAGDGLGFIGDIPAPNARLLLAGPDLELLCSIASVRAVGVRVIRAEIAPTIAGEL
jgi:hypothetical protein